jgi:hypothetical protein
MKLSRGEYKQTLRISLMKLEEDLKFSYGKYKYIYKLFGARKKSLSH